MPPIEAAGLLSKAVANLGIEELLKLVQIIFGSTRELAESYLQTDEAKALIAIWSMHLDFVPNVSGGAMVPFVESFANAKRDGFCQGRCFQYDQFHADALPFLW